MYTKSYYVCHTIIKKLQNRINELSITLCGSASLSDHACPTYVSCVKMNSITSQMLPWVLPCNKEDTVHGVSYICFHLLLLMMLPSQVGASMYVCRHVGRWDGCSPARCLVYLCQKQLCMSASCVQSSQSPRSAVRGFEWGLCMCSLCYHIMKWKWPPDVLPTSQGLWDLRDPHCLGTHCSTFSTQKENFATRSHSNTYFSRHTFLPKGRV